MLSTLLLKAPWSAFVVLLVVIVVAPLLGRWLAPRRRLTGVLTGLAALAVLGLTLYPDGAPYPDVTCNAGLPYLAPTAVESTANVLLFVPVTFLAALLWRRPVLAVLGAAAGSAAIEAVQAVVLVIGRACDTSDWITNTMGAVIGGALAAVSLIWVRRATRGVTPDATALVTAESGGPDGSPVDADPARR